MSTHPPDESITCGLCTSKLLVLINGHQPLMACPCCEWLLSQDELSLTEVPPNEQEAPDHRAS